MTGGNRGLVAALARGAENSHYEYARRLRSLVATSSRWLDVGCGHEPLPSWLPAEKRALPIEGKRMHGVDPDLASLRRHPGPIACVQASADALPYRSGAFDLVSANMVLEHLSDPGAVFLEISRVLRVGGQLLVHTPNAYGYTTMLARAVPPSMRQRLAAFLQGRREEDVYPTLYRANTKAVLRRLARQSGLRCTRLDAILSSAQLRRVPFLGVAELAWIRALRTHLFGGLRPCLIGEFRR